MLLTSGQKNDYDIFGVLCNCKYHVNTCDTLLFNSSLPGINGRHFTDDDFRCILVNEKYFTLIEISLKFVPRGPIDNSPAFV